MYLYEAIIFSFFENDLRRQLVAMDLFYPSLYVISFILSTYLLYITRHKPGYVSKSVLGFNDLPELDQQFEDISSFSIPTQREEGLYLKSDTMIRDRRGFTELTSSMGDMSNNEVIDSLDDE